MEVIAIGKKDNLVYMLKDDVTINNNGVLDYFIYGQGHKKTKNFRILEDVVLPKRWEKLSWLDICKIHEIYGIEVSNNYAECKTAGIVSRQTIRGYYSMYTKIKDIIPENFDTFFDYLKVDYMCSCFGLYSFDIVSFDALMSKLDSDYDSVNCKYKKEKCSLSEYIQIKYGEPYSEIINRLL